MLLNSIICPHYSYITFNVNLPIRVHDLSPSHSFSHTCMHTQAPTISLKIATKMIDPAHLGGAVKLPRWWKGRRGLWVMSWTYFSFLPPLPLNLSLYPSLTLTLRSSLLLLIFLLLHPVYFHFVYSHVSHLPISQFCSSFALFLVDIMPGWNQVLSNAVFFE